MPSPVFEPFLKMLCQNRGSRNLGKGVSDGGRKGSSLRNLAKNRSGLGFPASKKGLLTSAERKQSQGSDASCSLRMTRMTDMTGMTGLPRVRKMFLGVPRETLGRTLEVLQIGNTLCRLLFLSFLSLTLKLCKIGHTFRRLSCHSCHSC